MNPKTYIIAEAGVNHNGSFDLACSLIDAAVASGADAVKFQTYKTENLVTTNAQQANYQIDNMGKKTSQFEMLKQLELSFDDFVQLKAYCDKRHIQFLSTPFDRESVDFLLEEIGIETVKIPSGELTNTPFIHYIATKRKPIILSTGMSNMEEIHEALSYIAYGLAYPNENVSNDFVKQFYKTAEAKTWLKEHVTILHCTTEYPTPFIDINLKAMDYLEGVLNLKIGLSDHSSGIIVPIAAVARGATIIEKHFTISRLLPGPDHQASLEPNELKDMVCGIRTVEQALGEGEKRPTAIEEKNKLAARKSLVALKEIKSGEEFTEGNLDVKRPGGGMEPSKYWSIIGSIATRDYDKDELINE